MSINIWSQTIALILILGPGVGFAAPEVEAGKEKNLGQTLIKVDDQVDEKEIVPSLRPEKEKDTNLGHFSPGMLIPRFGFGIAFPEVKDSSGFLGLIYGFESESFTPWEVGLDFLLKGLLQVQAGKRWIYFPRDSVRPFLKAALNWAPDPHLGLGNMVDWNRFQIRGGIGMDDLGSMHSRVRWELELAISPLQTLILISLGFPIPL
ncbi:MAG: hypothetical protein K2X47_06700 [Bdellovibrionales bacterium]|nr:hypothetical protein [Bdellovibrionales bacterium]